jgi:dihydrofolate synthase / folylpolyglutamate synthase
VPTPKSTLRYLYGLQKFGMKLGLRNMLALLRSIGNPERGFPSVHIAGTNGKGSTSSMIAAMLSAAGYKVGLYTSPHLVRFNERIRINGTAISDSDLIRLANIVRPTVDAIKATFFEATTAIAFKYFADNGVDIAIVETGLGGRLDATNVVVPLLSVITTIGKDHTEQLGTTLKSIAFEKGGIIKKNVPCISGVSRNIAVRELRRIARSKRSEFIQVQSISKILKVHGDRHHRLWSLKVQNSIYRDMEIPLAGNFQIHNVLVAISAIQKLESHGYRVPEWAIRGGLKNIQGYTGLKGRFELIQSKPPIIIDVAHNPDGVAKTIESLANVRYSRLRLVFGVMKDKDYHAMIVALSRLKPIVYAVAPKMERALDPQLIAEKFVQLKIEAEVYHSVGKGIEIARADQKQHDLLLVTGSHYVAGEAFRHFAGAGRKNNS